MADIPTNKVDGPNELLARGDYAALEKLVRERFADVFECRKRAIDYLRDSGNNLNGVEHATVDRLIERYTSDLFRLQDYSEDVDFYREIKNLREQDISIKVYDIAIKYGALKSAKSMIDRQYTKTFKELDLIRRWCRVRAQRGDKIQYLSDLSVFDSLISRDVRQLENLAKLSSMLNEDIIKREKQNGNNQR